MAWNSTCTAVRGAALGAALGMAGSWWATDVSAQEIPSILGTFTGSVNEFTTGCEDSADDGPSVSALTLIFDSQDASGNFTGVAVPDDDDEPSALQGVITVGGAFGGTYSDSEGSGSFGGTLVGDTLGLGFADDPGPGCETAGSGTLTRGDATAPPEDSGTEEAAGTEVAGVQRATTFARGYTTTVSSHVGAALGGRRTGAQPIANGFMLQGGGATGLSAGEGGALPFGVWGSYSRARSSNSFELTEYGADHDLFLGGIDFLPSDNVVVGVSLGIDNTDTRTNYNDGKSKFDAVTIGPYIGALINDWLTVDFTAAWSFTSYDQYRTVPGTGENVTSDPDGTRALLAGNINASQQVGDWLFSGRVGALWASDTVDAFTESDGTSVERNESKVGQFRVGAEVAYSAGRFEPYVGGTLEYDYSRSGLVLSPGQPQALFDDTGGTVNFGVRYYGSGSMSGSLEYNKVLGRSDFSMDSVMFMLRGDF